MSKNKRKAIVFDLDVPERKKIQKSFATRTANVQSNSQEEEEEQESPWVCLMQPETLNLAFMLEILDKENTKLSSEARGTRKEVEKIFLKHITSKPQRSHRSTRLGSTLSLLQKQFTTNYVPEWHKLVKDFQTEQSPPSTCETPIASSAAATDRLKPPVESCINTERKTIKLGGAKKDAASSPATSASPSKQLDKVDALLKSHTKSSAADTSVSSKRVLSIDKGPNRAKKLKTNTDSSASSSEEKSPSTPKKKHSAVSWP